MKKYIFTFALFVAFAATSFAQGVQKMTAEDKAKKSTAMMEKNLSLTADQKTAIYGASLEKFKAIDALRASAGEGNKPDASQMKVVNQKFAKVLKKNLSDAQKAKMAEMAEARGGNDVKKKPKKEKESQEEN